MYNWPNVAQRTEAVYRAALAAPAEQDALLPRLRRYRSIGSWAGLLFCCVVVLLHWFWRLLEWQQPAEGVEPAADWPGIAQMLGCADVQQQQKARRQQQKSGGSAQQALAHQHAAQQQQTRRNHQHTQHMASPLTDEQQAAAQKNSTPLASGGSRRYNLRSSAKQRTS
jgi:hypothetical protein